MIFGYLTDAKLDLVYFPCFGYLPSFACIKRVVVVELIYLSSYVCLVYLPYISLYIIPSESQILLPDVIAGFADQSIIDYLIRLNSGSDKARRLPPLPKA